MFALLPCTLASHPTWSYSDKDLDECFLVTSFSLSRPCLPLTRWRQRATRTRTSFRYRDPVAAVRWRPCPLRPSCRHITTPTRRCPPRLVLLSFTRSGFGFGRGFRSGSVHGYHTPTDRWSTCASFVLCCTMQGPVCSSPGEQSKVQRGGDGALWPAE